MSWKKLLSREGVDITTISGIDAVFFALIDEWTQTQEESFFTFFKDRAFIHYIGVDAQDLGRFLYRQYFHDVKQIENYYREGNEFLVCLPEETKNWQTQLTTPSAQNLLQVFSLFRKQFDWINHIYSIVSWLALEAWQADFENMVTVMISRNHLEDHREKILASVYQPWKKTALLEIQEKMAMGVSVERLVEEYQFLRSWSVVWFRPIQAEWFQNVKRETKDAQEQVFHQEELIELLKPNEEEKHFLTLSPYITFFKDWRDDVRRAHAFHWSFLFEVMGKYFGIDFRDLGYLTLDEIETSLKQNWLEAEPIRFRKEHACVIGRQNDMIHVFENGLEAYQTIMKSMDVPEINQQIKGLIAQPGKITGRVRIITTFHDIKKVEQGDILVANTTHPNYLPAMQKAAAFVTNEGGIICHAAIVAREMKKPCIVGTKIATKVLKDGDLVEVDAEKGIVSILKRV